MSDKIAAQRLNNILCCKDILWQESRRVKTQPHIILSFSQKILPFNLGAMIYLQSLVRLLCNPEENKNNCPVLSKALLQLKDKTGRG